MALLVNYVVCLVLWFAEHDRGAPREGSERYKRERLFLEEVRGFLHRWNIMCKQRIGVET